MESPFPGMDPYLEQHWPDVHHRLVTYACDQIQPRLPRQLRARMQERVFVEIRVADEPVTQGYVEVVDAASGNRLVTVIEFLSPSNKLPGEGQATYRRKQQELRAAEVSLVEIDLTRTGRRDAVLPISRIPPAHRTTYQACVFRAWKRLEFEVYRAPLTERLPVVAVPLRQTDSDVPLDLQTLISQCYHNGGYDTLEYGADPHPPLEPEDAAWGAELLRSKGLR